MTETMERTTRRLLGARPEQPLPQLSVAQLIALVEDAGLTGRGGAGFPTARKLHATAHHRPVVVGNAMEGEHLSHKDAVLLTHAPNLVLDGLELLGRTTRARRVILAVGPEIDAGPAEAERRKGIEVIRMQGGFVAGQESALVNQINGRDHVPSDPATPVYKRGVDGRPTLVANAETLAQLALIARFGAAWFRTQGTPGDPGTFLATISGSSSHVLRSPGVIEAPRGVSLRSLLTAAEVEPTLVGGVLVGGYHGAWIPANDLDVAISRDGLAPYGASPGAGIVHVLDRRHCPIATSAQIVSYLAGESAGQCGPCVNGLPAMADTLNRLAGSHPDRRLVSEVERLRQLVVGRGACAHPDGTSRLVASTMRVFADHVETHLRGGCDVV
jgi:NADH:ubiquinone oxidoreductase subunit F (NADH-binding)